MDNLTPTADELIEATADLPLVAMLTDAGLTWPEIRAYLRARLTPTQAN